MNLINKLKKLVRPFIQYVRIYFNKRKKFIKYLSQGLSEIICVDVGASYYPHPEWELFRQSKETHWLAVEPNEQNLSYTKQWGYPCSLSICPTGLSEFGGVQALYITNVDSGSSLLPPVILESQVHRIYNHDYFFPVTQKDISTITLIQAIDQVASSAPIIVKLDTQGTELSILRGAEHYLVSHRIIGIEMESTMLAEPIMHGSGKFWEACRYLEGHGYELLHIHPIQGTSRYQNKRKVSRRFLNECDAVFVLRIDVVLSLPLNHRIAVFGFYISYMLYEEALAFLVRDLALQAHFIERKLNIDTIKNYCKALA